MSLSGLTVGVVFGSRSVEHEISIITACQAMPVLSQLGAEVVPVYITKTGRWLHRPEFAELGAFRGQLPEAGLAVELDLDRGRLRTAASSRLGRPRDLGVDVLLPCLHGTFGEDGSLAGLAEIARLPQVGSPTLAAALAMDKLRSKQLWQSCGLPVLPGRAAASLAQAGAAARELGYPVVVKPNRGGSSIGVAVVVEEAGLEAAVELALSFDEQVVLEPAVPGAVDLNCAVKRQSPRASAVERPLKPGQLLSYQDKYLTKGRLEPGKGVGPEATPAKGAYPDPRRELPARIADDLRDRVQALAVKAYDALGCAGAARVDFLCSDQGQLYLNEV
ncbi:MAG: D-alanine--D-alanine ligase family protein, partial [Candidatus Dormibacteria bacterium]